MQLSFSVKIDQLQEENGRLAEELKKWKDRADIELRRREEVEEELNQFKEINHQLEEDVQNNAREGDDLRGTLSWCMDRVGAVLPVLQELQKGRPSGQN